MTFTLYLIGALFYSNITAKETVLQGIFLNTLGTSEAALALKNDFLAVSPIDTASEDIVFNTSVYYDTDIDTTTSYQLMQVLNTKIAVGEADFIVSEDVILTDLAYNEYFCDLSKLLSEEQMQMYEPYFLYYDRAVVEKLRSIDFTDENEPKIILPDPSRPELMDDPIPIMINVSESPKLFYLYKNSTRNYAIAFSVNGANSEKALEFLNFFQLS